MENAYVQAMPEATELHAVPDAFTPVIKFKFKGISIDLLYARMTLANIPENLDVAETVSLWICSLWAACVHKMVLSSSCVVLW
jgi:poly(A) polymerase Pap1